MRMSLGRLVFAPLSDAAAAMVLGGNIARLVPQLAGRTEKSGGIYVVQN
jgi:hypothetical protein